MPADPVRIAVTRQISPAMQHCELTHLQRTAIDIDLAREQHRAYVEALRKLGCRVEALPAEPELADSVFVEDTAVVLDELAIITRPGAPSRRAEISPVAGVLERYRKLAPIEAPGTLDGGDVLLVERTLYVGTSSRSNRAGLEQLASLVMPLGYRVQPVAVHECLHLKSAVTQVAPDRLLLNPRYVDREAFVGMDIVNVDEREPSAANAVRIGGDVIYSASHPGTADALRRLGIRVHTVDMSETEKAEGGVTCCSLLFSGEL